MAQQHEQYVVVAWDAGDESGTPQVVSPVYATRGEADARADDMDLAGSGLDGDVYTVAECLANGWE